MSDSFTETSTSGSVTEAATSDSFTETSTTSWFTRIKNALIGILVGIILVIGAIVTIFWNEHRAIQTARSLAQGSGLVIDVDAQKSDPANEGKLVHVAGQASVTAPLTDADFGVTATGLRLQRRVEMYQWREEKRTETHKNIGGSETQTTTYTYDKVWSEDAIDSARFSHPQDHGNPGKAIANRNILAQDAKLGGFALGTDLLSQLSADQPVRIEQDSAAQLKTKNPNTKVANGQIYVGTDPAAPRIGDMRLSYSLAQAGPVSVVAAQVGQGFAPFQTQAGDKLDMIDKGTKTAAQMFTEAEQANTILTWAIRAALVLLIWIGSYLCLRPLAVLADVIPFLGSIVGFGLGLTALLVTLIVAPISIAIAWFAFRPVVAIAVGAAGLIIAVGLHQLRQRRAAPQPAAQPAG